MRLVVWLLGTEVIDIRLTKADPAVVAPPPASTDGEGTERTRHAGEFQLGFTPTYQPPFRLGDIEAQHPRGATP
ncbi:MAG: hypothetical protein AB7I24_05535 [Candidatus Nanopelagicales bacterium]